jgi:hypothetical protein
VTILSRDNLERLASPRSRTFGGGEGLSFSETLGDQRPKKRTFEEESVCRSIRKLMI